MKRIAILILALSVVLGTCSCGVFSKKTPTVVDPEEAAFNQLCSKVVEGSGL